MISVIIPAYRASEFLGDCIKSVLDQDVEKEVILGVDGCRDTLEFATSDELIKKNCSIFYFEKNVGTYLVLNSLIMRSSCDRVIFFGADDLMFDGMVREAAEKLSDFDIVRWRYYNFRGSIDTCVDSREHSPGACALRKELLLRLNAFFPWRISADWEFQLRAKHNGATTFLSEGYFFRRIHENNMTIRKDTGMDSDARKVYIEYIKKATEEKRFENPEQMFASDCVLVSKPA